MTDFETAGFLADDLQHIFAKVRDKHADEIDILYEINEYAQSLNKLLTVDSDNDDSLLACALHARILGFFQSYVINIERGMISPAHFLLRRMLEAVFALVAITRDPTFSRRYILAEQLQRFERLNTLLGYAGNAAGDAVDPDTARQFVEQFTKDHGENHGVVLSVEEIATIAGMQDWYATAYTVLADSVYAAPGSLDAALMKPRHPDAPNFTYRPSTDGFSVSLSAAAKNMLNAIAALSQILSLDAAPFVHKMRARIAARDSQEPPD